MKRIPSKWSPRQGDLVEIRFLDHVEDDHKPYEFHVYGRVASTDRKSIVVESWASPDGPSEPGDPNAKSFTILRSTILTLQKLRRAK